MTDSFVARSFRGGVGVLFLYLFLVDPILDMLFFHTKLGAGGLHLRTNTLINLSVFF